MRWMSYVMSLVSLFVGLFSLNINGLARQTEMSAEYTIWLLFQNITMHLFLT